MEKNWFGFDPHPTDDMIHWSNRDPRGAAVQLRSAYDRIEAAGLLAEYEVLLEAARDIAIAEEAELAAGKDI